MAKSALRWDFLPWFCNAINPPTRTSLAALRTVRHNQRASLRISPLLQLVSRQRRCIPLKRLSNKRFQSTIPPPQPLNRSSPESSLSLTQRMRKLSREYGWSALGVYLLLTTLDFPLCFLGVRWLGTDRIGHWEHIVLKAFWKVVPYPFPSRPAVQMEGSDGTTKEIETVGSRRAPIDVASNGHGVREAEQLNQSENASIWTQLALAYAIHKSFIFIRIPITAAVTPKVVKTLRGWGWDIGKRRPKAAPGSKDV